MEKILRIFISLFDIHCFLNPDLCYLNSDRIKINKSLSSDIFKKYLDLSKIINKNWAIIIAFTKTVRGIHNMEEINKSLNSNSGLARQAVLGYYRENKERKNTIKKDKQQIQKESVRNIFIRQVDERSQIILTKSRFYTEKSQAQFDELKSNSLEKQAELSKKRSLLKEKIRRTLNDKLNKKQTERRETQKNISIKYNQIMRANKILPEA